MDNEKNTPDNAQSPDQTLPAPVDANAETRAYPEAAEPGTAPGAPVSPEAAPAGRSRKRRNLLLGAGAAVALLAVGGGAFAIGTEVGGDDDDRPGAHAEHAAAASDRAVGGQHDDDRDADGRDDDRDRDRDRDRDDDGPDNGGSDAAGPLPTSDADSLRAAAEKAVAAADAEGAVSIDVERGGYEVEVRMPDGTEPDVFVTSDGSTKVHPEDDTESDADPLLDLGELDAIISAALTAAEAETEGSGTVEAISASDDTGVAFEVSVRLANGADVDVDLDADLAAVRVDLDD